MKTYNLFISHSWRYGGQYDRLYSLLRTRRYFAFRDYSVSQYDPIHDAATDAQLRQAIRDQMIPCHVVLILAGVYASYSKWINIEIDLAKRGFQRPKPVIAIWPRGKHPYLPKGPRSRRRNCPLEHREHCPGNSQIRVM